MPLTCDTRLGPYEILGPAGSGAMGEVYRARDTRLSRTVAIKVLPSNVSEDRAYTARLQREARAISSLNHPHICTLHDIGHENGIDFLVMEYVEGETLAKRLEKGPLPLTESLRYAIEILEGLEHAHSHGILHCDLKPSNILVTKSGAKLLDFGVATIQKREPAGRSTDQGCPEDTMSLVAEDGMYGTIHYMAPERLEGQPASASTDLFAFGAVLYEMVTGRKAFDGRDRGEIMAAILTSEPIAVSQVRANLPPLLDHLIARCLARHPDDRWQAAHDVRFELQWILEQGSRTASSSSHSGRWTAKRTLGMIVGTALVAVMIVLVARVFAPAAVEPQTMRFAVSPPEETTFSTAQGAKWMDVSPDGRWLVFSALRPNGQGQLWIRGLDSTTARPLAGTEEGQNAFWSADSRFLAFSAEGQLKKIDVSGGVPQTLCAIPTRVARGGTWNREGVLLFAPATAGPSVGPHSFQGGLLRVSAAGGMTIPVTNLDATREEVIHGWPQFLPDGRHFLYRIRSHNDAYTGIYLGSIDEPTQRVQLVNVDSNPMYSSGHLLFGRGGTLFAQPFDARRARLADEPIPIVEQVVQNPSTGQLSAGVSETGILAYFEAGPQQLVWIDRSGRELGRLGPAGVYRGFSLSSNGDHVAVSLLDRRTGTESIWIIDAHTNQPRRLTFESARDFAPTFSSDGMRIAFTSDPGGHRYLSEVGADGSQPQRITPPAEGIPTHWSRDGRFVVFGRLTLGTNSDIWVVPMTGDRKPFAFLQTAFSEREGQLSPDGRWMAYESDESGIGRSEVYVRPFPSGGGKWQISVGGGRTPKWRGDGHELFYLAPDGALMARVVRSESEFAAVGPPRMLFTTTLKGLPGLGVGQYDVTADGQRFLFLAPVRSLASPPITIVVNWPAMLHH
jgi:Tol biopolymer transport system component